MSIRARVLISGLVQGVFFRQFVKEKAQSLGLTGWVRNTSDGKVEVVFEGAKDKIEEIIEWCRKGPPAAQVEKVKVQWQEATGEFFGFEMKDDLYRR